MESARDSIMQKDEMAIFNKKVALAHLFDVESDFNKARSNNIYGALQALVKTSGQLGEVNAETPNRFSNCRLLKGEWTKRMLPSDKQLLLWWSW